MYRIGESALSIKEISDILQKKTTLSIPPKVLKRVIESHEFLLEYSKDKIIYGINTGLGPMAQFQVNGTNRLALQYNAIRSHSAGMGQPIPDIYIKSAMICSLNAYLKGCSGIHPSLVELLSVFISRDIIPVVPEHGGVGASGDLVQLAHIGLALISEGEVFYNGKIVPAREAMEKENIEPLKLHLREGLSLINGTYVMTGISIVNLIHAQNLLNWSIAASAMLNEIVASFDDYFSTGLNAIKKHEGQSTIAQHIRAFLNGSKQIRKRSDYFFDRYSSDEYLEDKVQEYYSLRCTPQILGPVYDTLKNATTVLEAEANSSSDNPVIDMATKNIYHGGNFHGEYVAAEADKMKAAIVKLTMLSERQLNFLLNSKLNDKLPPFVNMGKLGLNFGMQGAQFTATSTTAENQTLAFPMHLHSISCNNDNQDIVSMGTNAALVCKKVIENSYQVMAVEFMTLLQAFDILGIQDKISPASKKVYHNLRQITPAFKEDGVRYKELKTLCHYLFSNEPEIPNY